VADYSTPAIRRRRARLIRAVTVAATALLTAALVLPIGTAIAAGGNLDHFTVAVGATQTAGATFNPTLTAKDGNDRTVRNYAGVHCIVFSGPGISPNGTGPSYPAAGACLSGSSITFANGVASPGIKVYRAGANTLSVNDPAIPFSGGPASFTVNAGAAATLTFTDGPIDTKVGEPIYHTCVPDQFKPCAVVPASTPVSVSQIDAWGNVSADQVTILGVQATPVNGVATFGDLLKINQIGPASLHATTSGASVDSSGFQIVYDLKACDGGKCKNSVSNGQKNVQRAVNTISTSGDFFNPGTTNVILTTSFFDTTQFQGKCGVSSFIGMGTEAKLEGTGLTTTQPETTMLLLIPKKSLLAFGVSARSADSFQVCLGANRLDTGTDPWTAKDPTTGALVPAVRDGDTFWGTAANCSAFSPTAVDPCAALKTKNVGDVQAYFTSIGDSDTAALIPTVMANSDLAVIIRQRFPWDQKGMMN